MRAIEQVPRTWGSPENSACRSGSSLPPVPVPVGSPPWAMNPGITRWNRRRRKSRPGQARDPIDMAGSQVRPQLDDDVAAGRKGKGKRIGISHVLGLENLAAYADSVGRGSES